MTPPIYSVCADDAGVQALLGTAPRLYPFGDAPQGVALPYAVWQRIGGSPENFLSGRPDADTIALQIDVYAATESSATSVAAAIQHAIELSCYVTRYGIAGRDPDTMRYRVSFDAEWIVRR